MYKSQRVAALIPTQKMKSLKFGSPFASNNVNFLPSNTELYTTSRCGEVWKGPVKRMQLVGDTLVEHQILVK